MERPILSTISMAESEYIKIRRSDLQAALTSAFEAGWSGTTEMTESIVLTIMSEMDKLIVPILDESDLIQKLSTMMGSTWKDQVYGDFAKTERRIQPMTIKADYMQAMHDEWDAN